MHLVTYRFTGHHGGAPLAGIIDGNAILNAGALLDIPNPVTMLNLLDMGPIGPSQLTNAIAEFHARTADETLLPEAITAPPPGMTRMAAVAKAVPGVYLMDTGAAAILGVLGDPIVSEAVRSRGAVIVNVGNMHTFAALVRGHRLYGLFEHHTGGMTPVVLRQLVDALGDDRPIFDGK